MPNTTINEIYTLEISNEGIIQVVNKHNEVLPALKGTTIVKSLDTAKGYSEVTVTLLCKNKPTTV